MKRKRLIALLMAAVTVSASFVGCGEKEEKSNGETTTILFTRNWWRKQG